MNIKNKFVEELNNKTFFEVSGRFSKIIKSIFKDIKPEDLIHCEALRYDKINVKITVNGVTKNIVTKNGASSGVHTENLFSFVKFLKANGFSDRFIECIKLYHFADGTVDGSGRTFVSDREVPRIFKDQVNYVNDYLTAPGNRFKYFLLIDRFLCHNASGEKIDFMYFGSTEYGNIISTEELVDHIIMACPKKSIFLRFGPFSYHVVCRRKEALNNNFMIRVSRISQYFIDPLQERLELKKRTQKVKLRLLEK